MPIRERTILPVTIPAGQSLSNAVPVVGRPVVGIIMPAAWTTAELSFLNGEDIPPWKEYQSVVDLKNKEMSLPVEAGIFMKLSGTEWLGFGYLKLRSGTAATPVPQATERVIGIVLALD